HSSISSVAVAGDGTIYLASDIDEHRILSDRRGQLSVYAGVGVAGHQDGPVDRARFDEPGDLVVDADGSIYVLDQRVRRLRVIRGGQVFTLPLRLPYGLVRMAHGSDGTIYLCGEDR